MNRSELNNLMLQWASLKSQLGEIEHIIKSTVLELGETQEVGNVEAAFNPGRRTYRYKEIGNSAPADIVSQYTTAVIKTDWRKVVLNGMKIEQDEIPFDRAQPSVKLRMV